MRALRLALVLLVGIAAMGCASPTVEPYGPDTYVVHVGSSQSGAKAHQVAIRTANQYCVERGLHMLPYSESSGSSHNIWIGPMSDVRFVFRCLSEGDPELRRTDMRSVPDTVIENAR